MLEPGNQHKVAERLDKDGRNQIPIIGAIGRKQKTTIVSKAGFYSVILCSDKPEARRFKRCASHDVLPIIRRHGYGFQYKQSGIWLLYQKHAGFRGRTLVGAKERVRGVGVHLLPSLPSGLK